MALALSAAFGVRVYNPANTVAKRYPGPSDFAFGEWRKPLDPGFRGDDGNRVDQRI
jgi:hypothetical protein